MNAVLIGFRGTGKSSIAELVALCTDRTVYATDEEIVRRAGCSIPEFVHGHGWDAFRELESEVAAEAGALDNAVIDTGGGVIQRANNVAALKAHGVVFWLVAQVDTIQDRIKDDSHRLSLSGEKSYIDEVAEVLEARLPLYAEAADHIVETDGRTLGEIADEIVQILCTS